MILSIKSSQPSAGELSYLLHKHPARLNQIDLNFGSGWVFFTRNSADECEAVLLVEIDSVELIRGRGLSRTAPAQNFGLRQYVNDRPFCSSSFLSVALAEAFRSAMNRRCDQLPEAVDAPRHLVTELAVASDTRGGELINNLFQPLGYEVTLKPNVLDERFPEWGQSKYFQVRLEATLPLWQVLTHLYVLLPVLDKEKHYFVAKDEMEKLLARGKDWLAQHPLRDLIASRYLTHRRSLVREAITRLSEELESLLQEDSGDDSDNPISDSPEAEVEEKVSLHEQRLGRVVSVLKSLHARTIVDAGCGEGRLIRLLAKEKVFVRILGMDVAHRSIEVAQERLGRIRLTPQERERITLIHGSLLYRDKRLSGYDALTLIEVIEHLDSARLVAAERAIFKFASPEAVIVTTPNREYNSEFDRLLENGLRHPDHRFEFTRNEFRKWCESIGTQFGYQFTIEGIGPEHPEKGAPSQIAVFIKHRAEENTLEAKPSTNEIDS